MTPATDDDALEAAFEAFLAGRSAPPAAEGLVAFADGVRASAARSPRPNAALAELLVTGLLTDQSSEPARRAVRPRRWSTRRMFLACFAKIASAGLAAKAATVAGVVVVGVSTAGFTGALPGDLQHGFAAVVDTTTPLTAPDPSATTAPTPALDQTGTDQDGTDTDGTDQDGTGQDGTEPPAPTAPVAPIDGGSGDQGSGDPGTPAPAPRTTGNGLGGEVSQEAAHGGMAGGAASELAHERNNARRAAGSSTASTAPVGAAGGDDSADDSTTSGGSGSGSKGRGHSHG